MPTVQDATLSFLVTTVKGEVRPVISPAGQEEIRAAFGPGRVLQDRYVLERELGRGGMGQVYLARDNRLSRLVAIKVMLPTMEDEPGDPTKPTQAPLHEAFAEEARLGANLTHPAIAPVFDFGFHEGKPFTVFEYIPGETLQDLLRRRKRLPLDDVRLILAPLAQALDFAHSQHVVHRDLKPANIRATPQGQFKIIDLGLAKEFRRHVDWTVFAGTPAYASPEQAAGLASDGRTDQYALAVIAYEMLTGQRPFHHSEPMELLRMHRELEPPSPHTLAPDLPETICSALRRALRKEPNERFATCEEFAVAMGCQFLSTPAPVQEILLEADAHSRPNFWSLSSWQIVSGMRRMHLVLAHHSVWCDWHSGVLRWRVTALTKIKRPQWSKDLLFTAPSTHGTVRHRIRFSTGKECKQWYETLCALNGGLESGAVRVEEEPPQRPVILLRRRPSARYQLLGPVEVSRKKRWSGEAGLRVRGAMMEADAIIEVQEEQVPGFRGTVKRLSGTAVRAVDQNALVELRSRWFADQVRKISSWMLWMLATSFILCALSASVVSPLIYSRFTSVGSGITSSLIKSTVWYLLLLHSWPFLIALFLRALKWPQLMPSASIALFAFGANSLPRPIGGLVAGAMSGNWLAAATPAFLVLDPGNLAIIFFGGFLGGRTWRAYREFRVLQPETVKRSSPSHNLLGLISLIASLAMALLLAGNQGKKGYEMARTVTMEARHRLGAEQEITSLIENLKDRNSAIRGRAALALAGLGPTAKAAIPALIPLLQDTLAEARVNAALALLKIGPDKTVVVPLIEALSDVDGKVRQNAAYALAVIGLEAKVALPALASLLKDRITEVRVNAAHGLLKIGADRTVISQLIAALGDTDARVRRNGAGALGQIGREGKNAIPALLPLLRDPVAEVRGNAAAALMMIGSDNAAVADFTEALSDSDPRVRQNAALALGRIGSDALPAVSALSGLLNDEDVHTRVAAAFALISINRSTKLPVPMLRDALKSEVEMTRGMASLVLARMGQEAQAAIPNVLALVRDKSNRVRQNVVVALAQIGPGKEDVVSAIRLLLEDEDQSVRKSASNALTSMPVEALLRKGEHAKAALAAAQMASARPENATDFLNIYSGACYLGRCVPLARSDEALAEPERLAAAQNYADQAARLLRQAIAAGYKDFYHLQRDPDLDALRDHPGYRALMEKRE